MRSKTASMLDESMLNISMLNISSKLRASETLEWLGSFE